MAAAPSGVSAPVAVSIRNALTVPERSFATYATEAGREGSSACAGCSAPLTPAAITQTRLTRERARNMGSFPANQEILSPRNDKREQRQTGFFPCARCADTVPATGAGLLSGPGLRDPL